MGKTASKEEQRAAIEQIRQIVAGLGEETYISAAFAGVLQLAQNNIRDDEMNSFQSLHQRSEESVNFWRKEATSQRKLGEERLKDAQALAKKYEQRAIEAEQRLQRGTSVPLWLKNGIADITREDLKARKERAETIASQLASSVKYHSTDDFEDPDKMRESMDQMKRYAAKYEELRSWIGRDEDILKYLEEVDVV